MANVHVIEANVVEAKSARFNPRWMLATPTGQVLLISAAVFVGATAWGGLKVGLSLSVPSGCAALLGLRTRYWRDRARSRALQTEPVNRAGMSDAEEDELDKQEARRRDFPMNVMWTLVVTGVFFCLFAWALHSVDLALGLFGPLVIPLPFIFLAWYYRSRA